MASIRNRNGVWQARVIRKGHAPVTKSFHSKQDAQQWARQIEAEIDKGSFVNTVLAERTTFKEAITRYIEEVLPTMRGGSADVIRLHALARTPISKLSMAALTPQKLAAYRDARLKQVAPATVIRELAYFSSIINHARREWGININNPVLLIKKPINPQSRSRVLNHEETNKLLDALKPTGRKSIWMQPLVLLALETAMRRGELLGLRWEHIDLDRRTAYLEITKNGDSRIVPLSSVAIEILQAIPRCIDGRVFPINHAAVSANFDRARKRAGIENIRFHDLRRTAITALAMKLPNLIELSHVSGHRSLGVLKRYYQPNPVELARKLG
ncbi:site-specific integrase [Polynucleobacter sp. AP-Nino-20-G2]|uniref:tyrosine-type recombinase/integrase n=1 Tax=Polynucleobacter sp. AP-Nino-20-G2 TaxID=2576917 RepID=UPI001BFD8EA9|nr:site-specific integrase [Polynucleobacter sp. AP-Nino-20-G2]QWE16434.1 site-specific integrase [Polynucleobacter sp. AP-Nino-20-G2]